MRPPTNPWSDVAAPWAGAYPPGVPTSYAYPDVNAVRLLDDAATDFPDVVAIDYRRYHVTYRRLVDHVDRFATALADLDIGPSSSVAVALPNCPQLVVALFAAWRLGASVVLQRPGRVVPDPRAAVFVALDRRDARVGAATSAQPRPIPVVTAARHEYYPFPANVVQPLRRGVRRSRWWQTSPDTLGMADLVRRTPPVPTEPAVAGDRRAWAIGDATLTQRQLVVNSFQLRLWLPDVVAGDERVLLSLPLVAPIGVLWITTAVLSAATMVMVDETRSAARQRAAVRGRPTILPFDRGLADELLAATGRRAGLPTVRIAVSDHPLSPRLRARLETSTDQGRIRRVWGVRGVLTHADPVYGRADPSTVGLPLPDTDAVVVNPDRAQVVQPVGRRGRLWVRGPQAAAAGWLDAEVDATLRSDGYLIVHQHTDDAADTNTGGGRAKPGDKT